MVVGYAVLAHDDPAMTGRLVRRLGISSPIAVHLDARVDLADYESTARLQGLRNVEYTANRSRVNWGGRSVVAAMQSGFDQLSNGAMVPDHVVWLSGRCYPLRPVAAFEDMVAGAGAHRVFARAYVAQIAGRWHRQRYTQRHHFDNPLLANLPAGKVKRVLRNALTVATSVGSVDRSPLDVAVGSQWMSMPYECAREGFDAIQSLAYRKLLNGFAPDEMALQTFIHNSRWAEFTPDGGPVRTGNPKVSDLPNFHLLTHEMAGRPGDQDLLSPPDHAFFARKFSSTHDRGLLDRLDEKIEA